jgi:hypothetical protein
MPMRDRLIAAVYVLALVFGLTGCAETKFVPPSAEVRQHLGKIAVVAMPTQSTPTVDKPVSGTGSGALAGAGEAAVGGLGIGAEGCRGGAYACVFGLALGTAVAIVGAPIGAVVGAINAHSDEEVRAADANLRAALGDVNAGEELRNRVAAAAKVRTPYDLTAPQVTTAKEPDRNLIADGINSTLEITITNFYLTSAGKIDPDVTLAIVAEVRLRHVADGSEIYRRKWAYVGVPKNYFQMASRHAAMLRAEIQNGFDKLADRIVTDLFISNSPERQETSLRPGTVLTIEAPTLQKSSPAQNPPASPLASSTKAATSTGPVDVPFTIDLNGQSYEGVGKLENGHLAGQISSGNKTFDIAGEIRGNELSVEVSGAFGRRGTWDAPGNGQCSVDGSAHPASGEVTMSMQASCSGAMAHVTIHLNLPAAGVG